MDGPIEKAQSNASTLDNKGSPETAEILDESASVSLDYLRKRYGKRSDWYISYNLKARITGEKKIFLDPVQWIRWCAQNPVTVKILWEDMKVLTRGWNSTTSRRPFMGFQKKNNDFGLEKVSEEEDIDSLSIIEALNMYNWAVKAEAVLDACSDVDFTGPRKAQCVLKEIETVKEKVIRFFRKFWCAPNLNCVKQEADEVHGIAMTFTGIRDVLESRVSVYLARKCVLKGATFTKTIMLGKLLLSGKNFKSLMDELECNHIQKLFSGKRPIGYSQGGDSSDLVPTIEFAPMLTRKRMEVEKPEEPHSVQKKRKRIDDGGGLHRTIINRVRRQRTFRRNYEFPPGAEHDSNVLEVVITLVVPWLVAECINWPNMRIMVYPIILACKTFQRAFVRHVHRILCHKMLREYPHIKNNFPELWNGGNSDIISDKERWPGHWRTIGRILEMKGLCRGRPAESLVSTPVEKTYALGRIRRGDYPGITQIDAGYITKRWDHIMTVSKALNLFEAYVRIKNEICFECGYCSRENAAWLPIMRNNQGNWASQTCYGFLVQTDVFGGKVYVACLSCVNTGNLVKEKITCDSIPYCLDGEKMYVLTPFAKMIYMDYVEEDTANNLENDKILYKNCLHI